MEKKRNPCRTLVGKPEGKIPLRSPTRRLIDNVKMDLRDIERVGIDRIIWPMMGSREEPF
jgi:hypothetical protein